MNLVSSTTKDTQKSYLSPRQVVLDAGQVEVILDAGQVEVILGAGQVEVVMDAEQVEVFWMQDK